jgi:hypothetical protein
VNPTDVNTSGLHKVNDENFEAWASFLKVAHGDDELTRESAIELMAMEARDARLRGRKHIFMDSRWGPFMKFANVETPVPTTMAFSVREACRHWHNPEHFE